MIALHLSNDPNELSFLKDSICFSDISNCIIPFTKFEENRKCKKIALVFKSVLYELVKNKKEDVLKLLESYEQILICNHSFYYFIQFARPYITEMQEIIADIPGFEYFSVECDFSRQINANDYALDFGFMSLDKSAKIVCKNNILCYITNNQYNFLRVSFNYAHPLGKLLIDEAENDSVKAFSMQLSASISHAVFSEEPLGSLLNYYGEYMKIIDNTFDYSLQSRGIFKESIIESINSSLHNTVDSALLDQYGLADYCLSKNDFISWWFA